MKKYLLGKHVVKLSIGLSFWDPALACAFLRADPEYFDDAIAWTASMRNARAWRGIFGPEVDQKFEFAVRQTVRHGETTGFQPSQDERRCALLSPVVRPNMVNARKKVECITGDFAKLHEHFSWVQNVRVTQFAYLSNPDANSEIITGFIDAISKVKCSTERLRWLVDLGRNSISCFDSTLTAAGAHPIAPEVDTEAISHLIAAVRNGSMQQVREQLAIHRSVDQITGSNVNALMLAALRGNEEIVNLLLEHGADPTLTNSIGKSVFAMAAEGRPCASDAASGPCRG